MCTLSWLPDSSGYWVLFNRDERRTRGPGRRPSRQRRAGVRALSPIDRDAGGTWIGVNQFGVTAAILNRYHDAAIEPTPAKVSRGLLLQSLLDAPSARALIARLEARALRAYLPFTIAAFDRGAVVRLADWSGRRLTRSRTTTPGLVRTSSGLDQRGAERSRGARFAAVARSGSISPAQLRALHRDHQPARGALSICMHRPDARTQSLTEIRVAKTTATVRYTPGSPCRSRMVTPLRLSLS